MTALYLLEPDRPGAEWAPFAGVRPIAELRAGAWRIRERWEASCQAEASAILGAHVDGFAEGDEPPVRAASRSTAPPSWPRAGSPRPVTGSRASRPPRRAG